MKKLFIIILLSYATAQGQTTEPAFTNTFKNPPILATLSFKDSVLTIYGSKDSLIKYLVSKVSPGTVVKHIADSSGTDYTELRALQAENSRLHARIDSLQSKINKQLEYHYYSCEIISSLKPNGKLANRPQYHRAIRAFFERYGMAKGKFKTDKK